MERKALDEVESGGRRRVDVARDWWARFERELSAAKAIVGVLGCPSERISARVRAARKAGRPGRLRLIQGVSPETKKPYEFAGCDADSKEVRTCGHKGSGQGRPTPSPPLRACAVRGTASSRRQPEGWRSLVEMRRARLVSRRAKVGAGESAGMSGVLSSNGPPRATRSKGRILLGVLQVTRSSSPPTSSAASKSAGVAPEPRFLHNGSALLYQRARMAAHSYDSTTLNSAGETTVRDRDLLERLPTLTIVWHPDVARKSASPRSLRPTSTCLATDRRLGTAHRAPRDRRWAIPTSARVSHRSGFECSRRRSKSLPGARWPTSGSTGPD